MPLTIPNGQVLVNISDVSINSLANKLIVNGISFSTITTISNGATYESIQPNYNLIVSAGTQSMNYGTIVFSNANGVSFGLNVSQLTASVVPALSLNISAAGQLVTAGGISFSNVNNVTFGISNNSITASIPSGVNSTGNFGAISAPGSMGSTGTLVFANSNNISFGMNAGTLTASYAALGPAAISAGTTQATSGTVIFSNSNGFTFGMNGNTITASIFTQPSAGIFDISAGTTKASGNVVFSSSNNVSIGINGQTLTASAATSNLGITAISVGTNSISSGTLVFSNSNNISFGMNNNSLTATANIPTLSFFEYPKGVLATASAGSFSNATMQFVPWTFYNNITATQAKMLISVSIQTSTNRTMQGTLTVALGLYTNNAGTLSLASNGSQSYSWSQTSNGSTSLYNGLKEITVPLNINASPGHYWLGYWIKTSNTGTNQGTIALNYAGGLNATALSGLFGVSAATSQRLLDGLGYYTASTTTIMSSSPLSLMNHMGLARIPWVALRNI